MTMRRLVPLILFFLATTLITYSQPKIAEAEVMFLSRHVWRGEKLGTSMSIEPSVTASAGRFSFNVWAAFTPDNSYSEIDLIPSWQFDYFELSLLDYYNPVVGENNQYLKFDEVRNRHSVEVTLDNYEVEKQRIKWMAGVFILGDKNEETGKPFYSTYIECSYPFTLWTIDMEPSVGFTPARGYYANRSAVVSTSFSVGKEMELKGPFSIPLTLYLIHNPSTSDSFVTFATGIVF